jgi:hypothetical protein
VGKITGVVADRARVRNVWPDTPLARAFFPEKYTEPAPTPQPRELVEPQE